MKLFTTPVPNLLFDSCLSNLTYAELKVLLVIVRQTFGWQQSKSQRKQRDWINGSQFVKKTGLSRKAISTAVNNLVNRQLIKVTDYAGFSLKTPEERRGIPRLYYQAFPSPLDGNATKLLAASKTLWKKELM